ncbi:MAG: DNA-binding NarL/FixJ family response regulator [Psychrosphaera sp.]|jgi:DNA-binding NarL/FixJ family response regulator|uniref:response regulator transcription factor n=1 Tax=Psychrosphaera sp. F3M07 TaxID=2841560 RepID=UPI001C08C31A|nr:response regulator transcription factor [Psychrosphaera sp. F3M07]MBU2917002.1 response regulator transcription factor [Psychrosphaera sp. F3M07]
MANFLIADDHPLFREALIGALRTQFSELSIVESDSLESTIQQIENHDDLDLVLLDLHMPGSGDLYGIIRIREDYPELPVAVISGSDQLDIISKVMGFGAMGFISKSSSSVQIAQAINNILEGDTWLPPGIAHQIQALSSDDLDLANRVAQLTPQQYRVLYLLHEGLLNKQIAYELNVTEATIKAHITAIFRKLGINNRTQAVLLAEKLQLEPSVSSN